MLRKEHKIQIGILSIAAVLALVTQNIWAIVLLVFIQIGFWIKEFMGERHELNALQKSVEEKTDAANVRADEAVDKLETLIHTIPSPFVYINQRGDFEVENANFKLMINNESYTSVYDSSIELALRQILMDAFLNEKQFIRQFEYNDIDYQVLCVPLLTEQKRYNGCMIIFQDVTRVVEGEKLQKRFIADASHELRTPITSIKGMVEILNREGFDDPETAKEFHLQIEKENNRLNKIVDDLLLQSRLRANQIFLEKTVYNMKQFFDGIIHEKRQDLHQANIRVVLNCPSNLEILADHFRLSQVFTNLFNNAINYAKDGNIRINCIEQDKFVTIEFIDDGKGINPDVLPHIFERFFRTQPDRGRDNGGSGLGLAISKSIIEAHGGTIEVQSQTGEGTQFTITLPQEL